MSLKSRSAVAVLVPCLFGWIAEFLTIVALFRWETDGYYEKEIILFFGGLFALILTCGFFMGLLHGMLCEGFHLPNKTREHTWQNCHWCFHGLHTLTILGAGVAWACASGNWEILIMAVLFGAMYFLPIQLFVCAIIMAGFSQGHKLGEKSPPAILFGLKNEWEREEN